METAWITEKRYMYWWLLCAAKGFLYGV